MNNSKFIHQRNKWKQVMKYDGKAHFANIQFEHKKLFYVEMATKWNSFKDESKFRMKTYSHCMHCRIEYITQSVSTWKLLKYSKNFYFEMKILKKILCNTLQSRMKRHDVKNFFDMFRWKPSRCIELTSKDFIWQLY